MLTYILRRLLQAIPVVFLSSKMGLLVINGLMLWLTGALSDRLQLGFHVDGFWAAFWGGFVVSIVSGLLSMMMRTEQHVRYQTIQ